MSILSETLTNVPLNVVGSKAKNESVLQEKEKQISIPQHALLRHMFGFKKVDSKHSHKKVNQRKKKKKGK